MIAQNNGTQGMNNGGTFDAARKRPWSSDHSDMLNYADLLCALNHFFCQVNKKTKSNTHVVPYFYD